MDKKEFLFSMLAGIGTGFTWFFGWDIAIQGLLIFIGLDYFTGLLKGTVNKELNSNVGFVGLARKVVIFVVLIVAVILDKLMNSGSWLFRTLVCYFYIANEGLSILENCAQIGLPIPKKIKDTLAQLKEGQKNEIKDAKEDAQ
ncbi:MAG: holin family protein [Clostridiaceae bacterium]